ncbi:MAG: GNAT family N-acetyltransferase [Reichenbachiella sp.]
MKHLHFEIKEFDPHSASEELWEHYYDLIDALILEVHPHDTLPSRALRKQSVMSPHPEIEELRWLAFPKDNPNKIIGRGFAVHETPECPSFEANKYLQWGGVDVLKEYRGMNVGTELMKCLVAKAQTLGKTTLEAWIQLDSGRQFCEKLKGAKATEGAESRLYFKDIDWALMEQWKEAGRISSPGITIEVVSIIPDTDVEEFAQLNTEIVNQQPLGALESSYEATAETIRTNETYFEENGIEYIGMIAKDKNGSMCGMTGRHYLITEPDKIVVSFTGIKSGYRSRGLGKWLKAEMLFHLKNTYPSIVYESTHSVTENMAMTSINQQMGYGVHSKTVAYTIDIDAVAENL